MYTKGAVLLVCFQCVDTLVFASKHAEGMSLRCDVICALAYCGRHESSHIIKVQRRFNEIQQDDYLWLKIPTTKHSCDSWNLWF